MARTPLLLMLAVLTLTAFAGCSSKGTTGSADGATGADGKVNPDQAAQEVVVKATATTGVIRGVVVDAGIRPIAKALVAVQTSEKVLTTNTTTNGAFGFQGLKPGTYFLKVHKAGFTDQQVSVDVKAGDSNPAATKVLLAADASFKAPFFQAYKFNGFIECGVVTPVVAAAVCSIPNDPVCGTGPCTGNVTNDAFSVYMSADSGLPDWVQHELIWDSTQPLGDQLKIAARSATRASYDGGSYDHSLGRATGISPLLITFNNTVLVKGDVGLNTTGLTPGIFAGGKEGTGDQVCVPGGSCLFDTGATTEQSFTMYTHIFYGFLPPEGYRFSATGDPVPPQP